MAASRGELIAQTDYPVYVIKSIHPRYFIVGGGGGPSKTGVANGLEIFELCVDETTKKITTKSICKHNTGQYAIMNCGAIVDSVSKRLHLACGHDDKCYIYVLKQKMVTPRPNSPDGQLRKRKSVLTQADDFKTAKKIVSFDIQVADSMITDFNQDDAYQNCAAFTADSSLLATAGADGHIRLWKYPDLVQVWDIKAHDREVDDLHIDPAGSQICSTSRDGKLVLWSVETSKKLSELAWQSQPSIKYRHRTCRFCCVDRDPKKLCLFSMEVPAIHKQGAPCYLSQWNVNQHKPMCVKPIYNCNLASMDISDDGKYIGVGGIGGEVQVYRTSDLQCIYSMKHAHDNIVTGVAFAPSTYDTQLITDNSKFTILSISVDSQVKLHRSTSKRSWRSLLLIGLMIILICTFVLWIGSGSACLPMIYDLIEHRQM